MAVAAIGRASREALAEPENHQRASYRVLVIADSRQEVSRFVTRLRLEGYATTTAPRSLAETLRSLNSFSPDAVLLEASGGAASREIFRMMQTESSVPTMVVGEPSEEEQVWYLEQGAAEYLVPPLSFALLHARLRAVLRWRAQAPHDAIIRVGELEVDGIRHRVRHRGEVVQVTPTEFRLLRALAESRGRACSHQMLLERAWGRQYTSCRHYLRLYISYLRQKLEDDPTEPSLILTEWGVGYRLMEPVRSQAALSQRVMTVA